IPYSDAEEMLRTMCDGNVLDKVRHFVSHEGNNWHVDVYEGLLDGVVLAEIELADAGQEFALPDWIGAEVTSDPRYRKINMLADHVATQKSADTALLARADEVIELRGASSSRCSAARRPRGRSRHARSNPIGCEGSGSSEQRHHPSE